VHKQKKVGEGGKGRTYWRYSVCGVGFVQYRILGWSEFSRVASLEKNPIRASMSTAPPVPVSRTLLLCVMTLWYKRPASQRTPSIPGTRGGPGESNPYGWPLISTLPVDHPL
jgi:hypothetical protein